VRCSQVLSFSWIYMFMCVYMATIFFGQIFHRIYIYIVALPLPDINWLVVCFCWEIDLVCLLIGHSNSRIPWKLLQAHSNRYWPGCGLYLFCEILDFHTLGSLLHF
jgi:hypothetical protein